MNSDNSKIELSNVAEIVMGQSPSGDTYNKIGKGFPLLNGPTEFGSSHPTPALWTTEPTRFCQERDILFCVRGSTTGRMNWADRKYCIGRGIGAIRGKNGVIDTRFIYYTLVHNLPRLLSLCSGSVFPNLSRQDLGSFEIEWFDEYTRLAIAHILGTLDDKIELNQQMNRNLEAIASAIFKSWFVDFDPVRARMEGRQPTGMDAATTALFPDSFEDSLLGEIPKGWIIKPLDRVANFLNGLALQKYPAISDEYLPVIKIAELRRGITESSGRASPNINKEYVVEDGDILFSWSGSLEVCIWCGGKGALNQHLFKVTSTEFPKWFYYQWVKYYLPNFQAIAASKATTMGHIQRHHLTEAQVLVPPGDTLQMMDKRMAPLLNQIVSNSLESRTIIAIRDTLLPKLMLGEIRVKDAEKLMEAVA